jgi:hypothetical protein
MDASLLLLKLYLEYLGLPTRSANYNLRLNNYAIYLAQNAKADMGYNFKYDYMSDHLSNHLYNLAEQLRYNKDDNEHELHENWQKKLDKIKPLIQVPEEISGLSISQEQWLKWVVEYHYSLKVLKKSHKELSINNPLIKIIRKELKKAGLL